VQLPVSGQNFTYQASDKWLDDLAKLERFAIRRGTLGFRGWKPKTIPLSGGGPLTDADFAPVFEQKGVDMRIGLDIANFAKTRAVDRIVLVSGDQDMIPAMKEARKAGLEVMAVQMPPPAKPLHRGLLAHSDVVRDVVWPQDAATVSPTC
jgi:NYN domain